MLMPVASEAYVLRCECMRPTRPRLLQSLRQQHSWAQLCAQAVLPVAMAAFTACMPMRHESRNLVCAWSKGYECQCDTSTNGRCAKESHAEIAEKASESPPPGTLAGHWVVDRGDSHPAGGFAEKLGERTALHRAATQPTSGKGVGSLSTVELRNRSKFLGTDLPRSSTQRAALGIGCLTLAAPCKSPMPETSGAKPSGPVCWRPARAASPFWCKSSKATWPSAAATALPQTPKRPSATCPRTRPSSRSNPARCPKESSSSAVSGCLTQQSRPGASDPERLGETTSTGA